MKKIPLKHIVLPVQKWNPRKSGGEENFSYIDLGSINNRTKEIVEVQTVSASNAPSRARQLVQQGDIIVSTVRPNLNGVSRVPESLDGATASTGFCVLRPDPKRVNGSYLFHWVKSSTFTAEMTKKATGQSYPAVSDRIVMESEIPLPPLDEQCRIAAVLDKVDALRAKRREAIALLDNLTQSVFLDMFGDPRRNTKYWTRVSLGELIDNGPQNGLYKPAGKYGKGTPIVRIDAFYDGVINNPSSLKRVELKADEINRYRLYPNDILINRVNSLEYLGKCALVPPLPEPTVFESNMMRFSLKRDLVEPGYLVQFLQTRYVKSQIMSAAKNAVNQSSINQRDVRGIQVSIPPIFKQRDYLSRVSAITSLKEAHRTHLAHLDELFASLQQRAFRGDLFSSEAA